MSGRESRRTTNKRVFTTVAAVGFDLVWRLGRGSQVVLDWLPIQSVSGDLLIPIGSILVGTIAAQSVAEASTWLLFGIGFVVFVDLVYPKESGVPTNDLGFQMLFALFAFALTYTIQRETSLVDSVPTLILLVGGAIISFIGYLQIVSLDGDPWDAIGPTERALGPLQVVTTDDVSNEIETDLSRSGFLGVLGTGLWLMALGAILVFPCLVAAMLAVALILAYPLPDVLLLGWASYAFLSQSERLDVPRLSRQTFDIEERLFEGIRLSLRSLKGMSLTMYAIVGTFVAAQTFWAGGQLTSIFLPSVSLYLSTLPIFAWIVVGVTLTFFLAGIHAIWFWVREFNRLESYLRYYEQDGEPAAPNTRVRGLTIPGLAAVVLGMTMLVSLDSQVARWSVAVLWPVTALGTLALGWQTYRGDADSVEHEDHVIVGALLIQILAVTTLGQLAAFESIFVDHELVLPVSIILLPLYLVVVSWTYFDDVSRYSDPTDEHRQFVLPAFLILDGVGIGVSSLLVDGWLRSALGAIVAVCVFGGSAIAVMRYFDL